SGQGDGLWPVLRILFQSTVVGNELAAWSVGHSVRLGHYRHYVHYQNAFLAAHSREHAFAEKDAAAAAADENDPGKVQGRSSQSAAEADGVHEGEQSESAGRMRADAAANAGVHRILLHASQRDRTPRRFLPLGAGPVPARYAVPHRRFPLQSPA